jgi:hypothetical protein
MRGADKAEQLPTLRKTCKIDQKLCGIFVTDGCPKHFHVVKKYTTNPNEKVMCCAFKDFILGCVQKTSQPADREEEKTQQTMNYQHRQNRDAKRRR